MKVLKKWLHIKGKNNFFRKEWVKMAAILSIILIWVVVAICIKYMSKIGDRETFQIYRIYAISVCIICTILVIYFSTHP